jgi:hypothetical protein
MTGRNWIAVLCLVAGVPIAAYGLSGGGWLLALVGLALVLSFVYLVIEGFVAKTKADAPPIKPAANAAWSLKDQPLDSPRDSNKMSRL